MCISNYLVGGRMSHAVWKGLPLRELLTAAGPVPGVARLVLHAADGYTDTYPLQKALEPTTFVAYEMNGEPLPVRHGYPVGILTPGLFGENSVKWVTRIELVDHDLKGFYEQQGWGPNFVILIRTTFFRPSCRRRWRTEPLSRSAPTPLLATAASPRSKSAPTAVRPGARRGWSIRAPT